MDAVPFKNRETKTGRQKQGGQKQGGDKNRGLNGYNSYSKKGVNG